jgi:hypothetical protein
VVERTFGVPDLLFLVAFMAVPVLLWRVSNRARGVVRTGLRVIAVALLGLLVWNTVFSITAVPADSRGVIDDAYYVSYELDWLRLAAIVVVVLGIGWAFRGNRKRNDSN